MTHCTGPCDQGRLPCPCPHACWRDEPPEPNHLRVVLIDALIAAVIVAVIAAIGWRVVGCARNPKPCGWLK